MGRSFKTEGIVVKRTNFGEADKILTIFTKKHGKIVVLAKGIRRIHSRKAPHLELFSYVDVCVTSGRTFDYIVEAQTIESFIFLRSQVERVAQAFRIVEIVDRLCAEQQVHKNIFDLLVGVLRRLNDKNLVDIPVVVDEFAVELLWELGYLPKGRSLSSASLDRFLEQVMEKSLKSKCLLTKLYKDSV